MTKDQLRNLFIQKRNQLSQAEYKNFNQQLLQQFQQLDLSGIKCIHMFLPIQKRREPDTILIRDWLKINHPDIKIVYPQTNFANHTMLSFVDDADLNIENNGFDIPEPISGNRVAATEIDLILIPLLAFDKAGYRAGYGKGFYDRFMVTCKPSTRFIGISFFEPVDEITDINEFDIKMHQCITPDRIYDFNNK
jgi:5-formyltetrahydrofolate cyclo-ligase